uniref:Holin n=1 Tax=viral metagenome TaxID=1070528 RepID=A0A6M3K4P2_9ZZZZ
MKSVTRRILAIIFGVCGAGVMTYLAIQGSSEAFTALVAVVGTVSGFYFGVQNKS